MLMLEIDWFRAQWLQRPFDYPADVFRPAIEEAPSHFIARRGLPAKLGCDHDLVPERRERFAHQLFVGERTIDFGGIKEGDATFHGGTPQGGHFLLVFRRGI